MRTSASLRAAVDAIPVLLGSSAVAYVGAPSTTNVGDLALLEAHRRSSPALRFARLPSGGRDRTVRAIRRLNPGAVSGLCLGGGTLVGRPAYRRRLDALRRIFPSAPVVALGVGVEDPSFPGRTSTEELQRWLPLLRRIEPVPVRGPLSAGTLGELGVQAEVVGDPALLLDPPAVDAAGEPVVGVNLGATLETWGSRPHDVMVEVAAAVAAISRDLGVRVRVVAMDRHERDVAERLVAALPHVEGLRVARSTGEAHAALAGCTVVVAEKLHALVLAASASVPTIAIEYRPKCRDFHASIGRDRFTARTDEVERARLTEMIREVVEDRPAQADAVRERVGSLRCQLSRQASRLRRAIERR